MEGAGPRESWSVLFMFDEDTNIGFDADSASDSRGGFLACCGRLSDRVEVIPAELPPAELWDFDNLLRVGLVGSSSGVSANIWM